MNVKPVRCLCCGKMMATAIPPAADDFQPEQNTWYNPLNGIFLESIGGNYGSDVLDEVKGFGGDNVKVLECVICDACLRAHPDRWRITECTPLQDVLGDEDVN